MPPPGPAAHLAGRRIPAEKAGHPLEDMVNFNSHTDVVIKVAVDLVNLLTPGEERGRRYAPPKADERTAAVGVVLRGAGGREATWEEAASLCFVAAELRGVFEAVSTGAVDEAARQVNALLNRTGAKFCAKCGAPLTLACPTCGSLVTRTS